MTSKQRKCRKIYYQGQVTKIDYFLCQFEMDAVIAVYAGIFASRNFRHHLPLVGENIILKNVLLYDRRTLFLTGKSKIINSNNRDESLMKLMSNFRQFVLDFNLKPEALIKIKSLHFNLNALQERFFKENVEYSEINTTALLLDLLKHCMDETNSFHEIIIKVPSHFKPDKQKEILPLPSHIYWSMGICRSNSNEFLIGLLNVSNSFGFIFLSDTTGGLPVVITSNDSSNFSMKMTKLLNHFVVITKYRQISENYKNVGVVKYIYVDINDINIMETTVESLIFNATQETFRLDNINKLFKLKMYVLSKSSVTEKDNRRYCFIHAKYQIVSDDIVGKTILQECIFRITEKLLHLYPVFNEGDTYCIYTNCKEFFKDIFRQRSETIFTIFGKRLHSYSLPEDLKLRLIDNVEEEIIINRNEFKIYSVKEAHEFLKSTLDLPNRNLMHIEGVITKKRFFQPLKVDKNIKQKFYPFGTPGKMVHNVVLRNCSEKEEIAQQYEYYVYETDESYEDAMKQYYEDTFPGLGQKNFLNVNVFLHNFDNLQCPLALLPDMRVIFKYVTAEKGKYFKPSLFTSIQIVSYDIEEDFNSAFEILDSDDWGPQTCLGSGNDIPANIVCWGTTIHIKITQLLIQFKCIICKQIISHESFVCCNQYDYLWAMSLTLVVRDSSGICKVTTNREEVLRILLNKELNEWSLFRKTLKIIKKFSFNIDDLEEYPDEPVYAEFSRSLLLILRAWNEARIHHIDLKCRKMENKEFSNDFLPFWWCLEARRSFQSHINKHS